VTETSSHGGVSTEVEHSSMVCDDVVTRDIKTSHGGDETLTYSTVTTSNGRVYTYVTGTGTNGKEVSFTSLPSSSTIPKPTSYVIEGVTYTHSYVETSNGGFSTVTYETVPTSSGYVTYVSFPTPSGTGSYTETVSTEVTCNGTISYATKTLSDGQTVQYTTSTGIDSSGETVTYVESTSQNGGISSFTE
jgi:hypothetical protein